MPPRAPAPPSVAMLDLNEAARLVDPARPLIVTDADEVVLHFMAGLMTYFERQALIFALDSYAIHGNVRDAATGEPLEAEAVTSHLRRFFEMSDSLAPVEGAADSLQRLADEAVVLVLSNVPESAGAARARNLARTGITAPLVRNDGPKGAAVARLAEATKAPVFFIDDLPPQIRSVAEAAPDVHAIHYVANPQLARLVPPAPASRLRARDWGEIEAYIRAEIAKS